MNSSNICKFISSRQNGDIIASNFIYESLIEHSGMTITTGYNMIYLVESGEGYVTINKNQYSLTTGALFFTFSGEPFIIKNQNKLRYYYISFEGGRVSELFLRFGINNDNFVFYGNEGLVPFWKESLSRADTDNIDLLSESIILYSLSRLKKSNIVSDKIAGIISYMDAHFTDSDLSLKSIADAVGYDTKYLSHLFKQQTGIGFSERLRSMRIKHAITLIENGVTSSKNVAALCGFSDPLYFSRVFKKTVGISPQQYKNKLKI